MLLHPTFWLGVWSLAWLAAPDPFFHVLAFTLFAGAWELQPRV
jgi:hypothetical protein